MGKHTLKEHFGFRQGMSWAAGVCYVGAGLFLAGFTVCGVRQLDVIMVEEGTESFANVYGPFGQLACLLFLGFFLLAGVFCLIQGARMMRDSSPLRIHA